MGIPPNTLNVGYSSLTSDVTLVLIRLAAMSWRWSITIRWKLLP